MRGDYELLSRQSDTIHWELSYMEDFAWLTDVYLNLGLGIRYSIKVVFVN